MSRVQEGVKGILLDALRDAQELLSLSDLSSGQPCIDLEGRLKCLEDLIHSDCLAVTMTGRSITALGEQPPTPSALQKLRDRWA